MLKSIATATFIITMMWSSAVFACGGGFGESLKITPSQTIIIRHHAGEETYIFNPDFCGAATDFGLILPIPNKLTVDPAILDKQIYGSLEELTAPQEVDRNVCIESRDGGANGMSNRAMDGGIDNGVNVINSGQVGIFDWSLLQADDAAAFTDWLDANQYPYDEKSVEQFDYYVDKSWYFIAFKVTAAQERPAQGRNICGSFGPIRFAFTTDNPVIPTRIASVGDGRSQYFTWRIHALTAKPMTVDLTGYSQTLYYAGVITRAQLKTFSKVATIAVEGDQLTTLDVSFAGSDIREDITLTESSGPTEYRKIKYIYHYIDCSEGSVAGHGKRDDCSDCDASVTSTEGKSDSHGDCSIARDSQTSSTSLPLVIAIGFFVYCYRSKRRGRK
jgi:hypothetical protein